MEWVLLAAGLLAGILVGMILSGIVRATNADGDTTVVVAPGSEVHLKTVPALHKCRYCDGRLAFVRREQLQKHLTSEHADEIVREGGA